MSFHLFNEGMGSHLAFKVSIVDNNLLRLVTDNGNAHLYENYFYALEGRQYLNVDETRIILTPGGALEFLAIPLPVLSLANEVSMQAEAKALLAAEPFDAGAFNRFRARLMNSYEKELRRSHPFSASKISRAIGTRRSYIDPLTEEFIIPLLKGAVGDQDGRNHLYSRTAIDRTYLFPWPQGFKKTIMQAYLADAYAAFHAEIGFGSMRGFEFIWKDFSRHILGKERVYRLDRKAVEADVAYISNCVSFKTKGDFLDVEAIHYSVVGRFHQGSLEPVIFSTNDPVDGLLIRLGVFKSMYIATHQMVTKEETLPTMAQGIVMVFNRQAQPEFEIHVDKIPAIVDTVGNRPIQDWLQDLKTQFACTP